VVAALGEPPLYEPPRNSTPAFARYGDLDFTIENDRVSVISLHVNRPDPELPEMIGMTNFKQPALSFEQVERLLDSHGVTWTRFEPMCIERTDYHFTSVGVHLSFHDHRLGLVGATSKSWPATS
jgi:hypothetical protein